MQIWRNLSDWRSTRSSVDPSTSIGLVPTMGCLHQGHGALLKRARAENQLVVLSLFVNPTQFNDVADYEHYPNTLNQDLAYAKKEGVDHVLLPSVKDMYPEEHAFSINCQHPMATELEGAARPEHFNGVFTVVMKLFNLVRPTRAYFGEKDIQQLSLIQAMTHAFFVPVDIIAVDTVREPNGLPCSSRNQRFNAAQRKRLNALYEHIPSITPSTLDEAKQRLEQLGVEIDYLCYRYECIFIAFRLDGIRLIDHFKPKEPVCSSPY